MKIVVIGLGSMGKRRLRLLRQYTEREVKEPEQWELQGVDFNENRRRESEEMYGIPTYQTLQEALNNGKIDCAVISTSPHTHAEIISDCLKHGIHVFTEINLLANGYEDNILLAKKMNRVLFLSSTFMYRKEIEYIKKKVQNRKFSGFYQYHIGQYLPEWHPWESYKNFFVGRKDTNACREIFGIELPWITDVFGRIEEIHSVHKKISGLEIDYDDSYQVQLKHKSGVIGSLTVDVVTPKAGRNLELWSEGFYIGWSGTPDSLVEYDNQAGKIMPVPLYQNVEHRDGYQKFVVENAYYEELRNFIHCVEKKEEPRYTFEKDRKVLSWIDEIEK